MLTTTNLCKSYGQNQVLKNISVTIKSGEITTLIGPSGCGKTSLLRSLAFLEQPDSGSLTLNDTSYHANAALAPGAQWPYLAAVPNAPWPLVTVVFQQLFLWPHLTLKENILLSARNLPGRDHEAALNTWVKKLGMADFINRYPNEASGGQKQRVAITRALMLRPQYLLLDEITSALDVQQTARILQILPELKARGMGILLITHALNFAKQAADQVLFMKDGAILEAGTSQLLQKPKTKALQAFLHDATIAS